MHHESVYSDDHLPPSRTNLNWFWMEVNSHFKEFLIPNEQEAGWSPESLWILG
jgi:hypothetical protein